MFDVNKLAPIILVFTLNLIDLFIFTYCAAACEWVSGILRWTRANRIMINNLTCSGNTAGTQAWVNAFMVVASFV